MNRHPALARRRAVAAALVAACLPWLAGCAASARPPVRPPGAAGAGVGVTLEVRLRRSAELVDPRGPLRLFDQDLRVEYRAGGRGPALEAGEVTIDGRPLSRTVDGRGRVAYRLGREDPAAGTAAGDPAWVTLANSGGPGVPAEAARVRLAPFPVVTHPAPAQAVLRAEELLVVTLPPLPELWHRVTLTGVGDPVTASDLGEGRWLFPRGSLSGLASGRARLLIEVESGCGDCPAGRAMRANWSSRTELELALTML